MVWVKEEEEKGEGGINNSSQWINKVKMIFCFTSFWGNKVPTAEMFFTSLYMPLFQVAIFSLSYL